MKKGILFAVVTAVVLTGLAMSCNNDEKVTADISGPKAAAPDGLDVRQTFNKKAVIFKWNAVQDAYDYAVYFQQEGKKTIVEVSQAAGYPNNEDGDPAGALKGAVWSKADNNTDGTRVNNETPFTIDNWGIKISVRSSDPAENYNSVTLGGYVPAAELVGGRWYRFGVATRDVTGVLSSEIKWTDEYKKLEDWQ